MMGRSAQPPIVASQATAATGKRPDCGGANGPRRGRQRFPRLSVPRPRVAVRWDGNGSFRGPSMKVRPVTAAQARSFCRLRVFADDSVGSSMRRRHFARKGCQAPRKRNQPPAPDCALQGYSALRHSALIARRRPAACGTPASAAQVSSRWLSESDTKAAAGCPNAAQPELSTISAPLLTAAPAPWQAAPGCIGRIFPGSI
jgi:hypothetical protein